MRNLITLPGIGGSGEAHWQSHWELNETMFSRFQPASWNEPDLSDWMQSLERAVINSTRPPVLIAHSLACLLVAHWAASTRSTISGAMLVSAPDPDGAKFPQAAKTFGAVPIGRMPFPSLIVASTDDPFGTLAYARQRAQQWQSGFVVAGALGHINASSGLGDWVQGRALLEAFLSGLSRTA